MDGGGAEVTSNPGQVQEDPHRLNEHVVTLEWTWLDTTPLWRVES